MVQKELTGQRIDHKFVVMSSPKVFPLFYLVQNHGNLVAVFHPAALPLFHVTILNSI
jgi:hypothetical protein